jgi:hypothetical protein
MKRGLALHSLATLRVATSKVRVLNECILFELWVKNDEDDWRHDWSDMGLEDCSSDPKSWYDV